MAKRCGQTWMEHVDALMLGMMMVGLGGGCEGTYEALIEVAEVIRQELGLAVYTAEHTAEIQVSMKAAAEAQEQAALEARVAGMPVGRG